MTSVETEPPSRIRLMEYYLRCGTSDPLGLLHHNLESAHSTTESASSIA